MKPKVYLAVLHALAGLATADFCSEFLDGQDCNEPAVQQCCEDGVGVLFCTKDSKVSMQHCTNGRKCRRKSTKVVECVF